MVLFICCRDAEDSAIGATSLQALSSRVLHPLSAQACNRCASPRPVMMSNAVRACARCCRRLARQSWRLLRCLHSKATLRSLMLLCGRKHECINIECASRGRFFLYFSLALQAESKVRLSCSALEEVFSNVYRHEHLVLAYARPSISQMIGAGHFEKAGQRAHILPLAYTTPPS